MKDECNDFRKHGRLFVRFMTEEDKGQLLDAFEREGLSGGEAYRNTRLVGTRTPCVFRVDLIRRAVTLVSSITACACMASAGVRFYSVDEFIRLAELGFRTVPRFPIFHVPHDGYEFPEDLMRSVCVPGDVFMRYHDRMRDLAVTDAIPREYYVGSGVVRFPVSRLLCDVERFVGPEEPMERYGMGFCYERAYDGTRIKAVTQDLLCRTKTYYRKHHAEMDEKCARHSRVLLFDLHSYSDEIVPDGSPAPGEPTPDVCVGTDPRFTPEALKESVCGRFWEAGFSVALNAPYEGCFVPHGVLSGRIGCDCAAVMIELNKRCYLAPDGSVRKDAAEKIREVVRRIMADCAEV